MSSTRICASVRVSAINVDALSSACRVKIFNGVVLGINASDCLESLVLNVFADARSRLRVYDSIALIFENVLPLLTKPNLDPKGLGAPLDTGMTFAGERPRLTAIDSQLRNP
jgi:hypothetical protein